MLVVLIAPIHTFINESLMNHIIIQEVRRRDANCPIEVQILIPQPFMGTIIGTGGMKIKDLRKVHIHNMCMCMY